MEIINELPESINYNVYNGLNLMNEELGQSYVENGFNPFGDDFVLDEEYVTEQLENNSIKEELTTPNFILEGDDIAMDAFQASSEGASEMVDLLQGHLNNPDIPEPMKIQFRKMLAYLLSRNELIRLYKKKKKKERNALLMYQNLNSLNWELGKPLRSSYQRPFNAKKAMEEYSKVAENRARRHMRRLKEKDMLIERAREIMEKNRQELMQQGQNRPHRDFEKPDERTASNSKSLNKNISKETSNTSNAASSAPSVVQMKPDTSNAKADKTTSTNANNIEKTTGGVASKSQQVSRPVEKKTPAPKAKQSKGAGMER